MRGTVAESHTAAERILREHYVQIDVFLCTRDARISRGKGADLALSAAGDGRYASLLRALYARDNGGRYSD